MSACTCGEPPKYGPGRDGGPTDACEAPFAGAGVVLAAGLAGPRRLATDGADLFVSEAVAVGVSEGRLVRVPLGGGAPEVLASGLSSPDDLTVDAEYVYLLDENGLWRVNKQTSQLTQLDLLSSNAIGGTTDVEQAGQTLVIATGFEALVRIATDGTSRAVLHLAPAGATVRAARIDGERVWFLVAGDESQAAVTGLYEVPLDGSSPAVRRHPAPLQGRGLWVGEAAFVWTEGFGAGDGRVVALDRVTLEETELARGLRLPAHPVAVGAFVYFQTQTDPPPEHAPTELFLRRTSPCAALGAPVVGPQGYGVGDLLRLGDALYFTSNGIGDAGYVARLP